MLDNRRHDSRRDFGVRNAPERPYRVGREMGNGERHVEPAVARETGEKRIGEAKRRRRPARRKILHDKKDPWSIWSPSANCAKVEWRGLGRGIGPKQDARN